jgi:basic membrane lipoprotein Med (substrate-binding protein (PBP1-ABC) superfamily)
MRITSSRVALALLATAAVAFGACSSSGSSSAPSSGASAAPSGGGSALKIGLVTDVGTLNDKNFNEYSWLGTQDGASRIGAPAPKSAVSTVSADIQKNIQSFVDQKFDVIVTVGFAATGDTYAAARKSPGIKFIGVDQAPCLNAKGDIDNTFADCSGDMSKLTPNYQGIQWYEQQPGYLAGIVAGSISKSHHIGAIGGTKVVPAVTNYILGYIEGAKSADPNIKVETGYVSAAPDKTAFADPAAGNAFAKQMLSANAGLDVLFQVAGLTGNGVLQAACDAKIYGIGVDVDQFISTPDTAKCTVVSAEKKLKKNVSDAIFRIANKTDKGGVVKLDIKTDDVGLSPFHDFQSMITPDIQKKLDDAVAAMKAGTLKACNENQFGGCVVPK